MTTATVNANVPQYDGSPAAFQSADIGSADLQTQEIPARIVPTLD